MTTPTVLGPVSTLARYPLAGEFNLDFTRSLPEGFVITRDTAGCYIDPAGYPRIAAPNVPMFEKDGLLLDGANTNYLPNSEHDSGTVGFRWWAGSDRASIASTYKFGDLTMARFQENAGSFSPYLSGTYNLPSSVPLVVGAPICISGFLKLPPDANGNRYIWLQLSVAFADGGTGDWRIAFRGTGSSTTSGIAAADATITQVTTPLADGIVRSGVVITPARAGVINSARFVYNSDVSVNTRSLDGSGAIDAGGWQISNGLMTCYIRTGNTPTTRAMDSVSGPVSNMLNPVDQSGTVFADYDLDGFAPSWTSPFRFTSAAGTNRFYISVSTGNTSKWQIAAPVNFNPSGGTVVFPGVVKTALKVNPADIRAVTNGSTNSGSAGTGSPVAPEVFVLQAPDYRRFRFRQIRSTHEILTGTPITLPTVV